MKMLTVTIRGYNATIRRLNSCNVNITYGSESFKYRNTEHLKCQMSLNSFKTDNCQMPTCGIQLKLNVRLRHL